MKNCVTNLIKTMINRSALRLVLVSLFLSCSAFLSAATYYGKCQVCVDGNSSGMGKVYVAKDNGNLDANNYQEGCDITGNGWTESSTSFTAALYVRANEGYYHEGWYQGTTKIVGSQSNDTKYSHIFTSNLTSEPEEPNVTLTAVFKPYITVISQSTIVATQGDNDISTTAADVSAAVYGSKTGDQLTVTLIPDNTDANTLAPENFILGGNATPGDSYVVTTADGSNFAFTVGYVGNETDLDNIKGKNATLQLSAEGKGSIKVKVQITGAVSLTFKGTNGKGRYTASLLRSDFDVTSSDSYTYNSTNSATLNGVEVALTEDNNDDYIFFGWRVTNPIDPNNKPIMISYAETQTYNFSDGDVLEAVFVPNACAYMVMNGESGKLVLSKNVVYDDLHDALTVASSLNGNQVVVFENLATIFSKLGITASVRNTPYSGKEGTLPSREGGYTIPKGVTLLIPGTSDYKYVIGEPEDDLYKTASGATPSNEFYRKLKVADNTRIKVNYGANISVFSHIYTYAQSWGGMPINYGWIELGSNSRIELGDIANNTSGTDGKAGLYALGYVTNSEMTTDSYSQNWGRVVAYAGAELYETLQYTNWRGGTVGATMILGSDGVFPIVQYYFQNIEAPLELHAGAEEWVVSSVDVGMDAAARGKFIGSSDAFFCLGTNAVLTKYYDKTNDRQRYIVNSSTSDRASVSFENLAVKISFYTLESKNYAMPVTTNMDIELRNVEANIYYDLCILAGSSLYIHDDAIVNIAEKGSKSASVYVYDKDQAMYENVGYMGSQSPYFQPLYYTPYGSHTTDGTKMYYKSSPKNDLSDTKYKRKFADLADATIDVNGKVIIGTSYSSTAGLYTTVGTANIISSGKKGIVKFNNVGTKTSTKQRTPSAVVEFPVTQAVLTNDDDTKVNPLASAGIVYRNVDGKWITSDWNVEDLVVTLPNETKDTKVSYTVDEEVRESIHNTTFTATITGTGFCFVVDGNEVTSADIVYDKSKDLEIDVRYKAQDTHGVTNQATIKFANKTYTKINYSTPIKATENYKPEFTVAPTENIFAEVYVNSPTQSKVAPEFTLSSKVGNVSSLVGDATYGNRLEWKVVSVSPANTPFTFAYGQDKEALSDAVLSFNPPTNVGNYNATFTLSAVYTDKNGAKVESEPVEFTAEASTKAYESNAFTLTPECIADLQSMCVNVPVKIAVENLSANIQPLTLEFVNNGTIDSPVLTYTGTGTNNDPFMVTATSKPSTMPTIKVVQETDGVYAACESSCQTGINYCYPDVVWNWSDLYFGESGDNPLSTSNTEVGYTLELKSVTKDGAAVTASDVIVYDENNKTYTIKSDLAASDEYVATFEFEQSGTAAHSPYTTTFTSNIYAKPNTLSLCVDNNRVFKAVNYETVKGNVEFNNSTNSVELGSETQWVIRFVGVPDMLSFKPTANTYLVVEQKGETGSFENLYAGTVEANKLYKLQLLPTTQYLRFTTTDATAFSQLCVEKLNRVRVEGAKILYLPISDDPVNNPTTRTFTLTYVSSTELQIQSSTNEITTDPVKLSPTHTGEFKKVTVTVSSIATTEYEASLLIKYTGGQEEVKIETYRFPQKLPIQLERGKDPSKRFYFVASAYKNTEWDATNYAVNMQNKTASELDQPCVTFAFDGAPSFISFVPTVATAVEDWKIEEGETAESFNPASGEVTNVSGVIKQMLSHTSHYVRVTYVGTSADLVKMTKVNILSDQSAIPNVEELQLAESNKYIDNLSVGADLEITTVNLMNITISSDNPNFTLSYGTEPPTASCYLDATILENQFGEDAVGRIPFKVFWNAKQATDFATLTITTNVDGVNKQLATVALVGTTTSITGSEILYTGVKSGYNLAGNFTGIYGIDDNDGTNYRPISLTNTYDAMGKPLFDYLIIYGETTTTDGSTTISTPTSSNGSNAKTPVYIYMNDGTKYNFAMMEENANTHTKIVNVLQIAANQQLRVYITGFCPYASTGYTKEDEGVWFFQGENGAKLDLYLEDCYIYSRNKTLEGRSFKDRYDGQAFSENYVRGSGAVFVFENTTNSKASAFNVTIHTRNNNMLKSNYGAFYELMKGMRAFQVSSPIQVHLNSESHMANSVTALTFDDKWPTDATDYSKFERTNGFLSLQKQHNNAPSIDLGNPNTIVNFMGGRVELQNAAVVSANYKTTLAISFRSGLMAGFPMAYGIGTDDIGGQINFYDGTTTVIPMYVDAKFKDFYLLDKDAAGNYITDNTGTKYLTSCLRCPTNTKVYGGSHTMMRACEDVTSKGGAPTDENGKPLGLYIYPKTKTGTPRGGFSDPNAIGLVTPTDVPAGYNVESVTPETNNTQDMSDDYLNFWFTTEEESSVVPEVDKVINFWKACMTEISAEYMSYGGTVGGKTMMLANQEVKNFLYCQIDENIHNVIYAGSGFGEDRVYSYQAPVKDPTGQLDVPYLTIPPSYVGEEWQNYVETVDYIDQEHPENNMDTGDDYEITEKVYYIIPATADIWMTFTAPFNVEKLWVVETYEESKLAETPLKKDEFGNELSQRQSVLIEQAKHNADFAAFFGVAMALGRDQTFEEIHRDYEGWALYVDKKEKTRGKIELKHYNGKNFMTANYYLYHNAGEWTRNGDKFDTQWKVVGEVAEGGILMRQGETYSMLFPYCTGCDVLKDENGNIIKDANGLPQLSAVRDYWDYWSGKFLIFESTQATSNNPHTIKGSEYHDLLFAPATSGDGSAAVLTGNSTFALMTSNKTIDDKVYTYSAEMGRERFKNVSFSMGNTMVYQQIQPTVSFLIADIPSEPGMPARNVMRSGEIIYGKDNTSTDVNPGGHIPTVGGGNDLFITATVAGINIAVAEPQQVRVMSATGAIIYSGMVQTAVDVTLPTTGVYVITGENEVHKILH